MSHDPGDRAFIDKWKTAGPALERQREQDIRDSVTARDLPVFFGWTEYAVTHQPPTPTSGLVDLHRWLDGASSEG